MQRRNLPHLGMGVWECIDRFPTRGLQFLMVFFHPSSLTGRDFIGQPRNPTYRLTTTLGKSRHSLKQLAGGFRPQVTFRDMIFAPRLGPASSTVWSCSFIQTLSLSNMTKIDGNDLTKAWVWIVGAQVLKLLYLHRRISRKREELKAWESAEQQAAHGNDGTVVDPPAVKSEMSLVAEETFQFTLFLGASIAYIYQAYAAYQHALFHGGDSTEWIFIAGIVMYSLWSAFRVVHNAVHITGHYWVRTSFNAATALLVSVLAGWAAIGILVHAPKDA
jgi:hypothetical protein